MRSPLGFFGSAALRALTVASDRCAAGTSAAVLQCRGTQTTCTEEDKRFNYCGCDEPAMIGGVSVGLFVLIFGAFADARRGCLGFGFWRFCADPCKLSPLPPICTFAPNRLFCLAKLLDPSTLSPLSSARRTITLFDCRFWTNVAPMLCWRARAHEPCAWPPYSFSWSLCPRIVHAGGIVLVLIFVVRRVVAYVNGKTPSIPIMLEAVCLLCSLDMLTVGGLA